MEIAREDLLRVRELVAENGTELSPDQVLDILREVDHNITVTDEPGLISMLKETKEEKNLE